MHQNSAFLKQISAVALNVFTVSLQVLYIRAKKLRYAAELLSGRTEMSVGDVAHLVGYGNQSKFASAFRAVYGYSPLEYRRRMKNNASEQKKRFSE